MRISHPSIEGNTNYTDSLRSLKSCGKGSSTSDRPRVQSLGNGQIVNKKLVRGVKAVTSLARATGLEHVSCTHMAWSHLLHNWLALVTANRHTIILNCTSYLLLDPRRLPCDVSCGRPSDSDTPTFPTPYHHSNCSCGDFHSELFRLP